MRRRWEAKGKAYYYIVSYLFVFVMQASFSLVVNASALYISLYSTKESQLGGLDYAGAIVFLIGFLF